MNFNGKDEALKLIKALSPAEAKKIINTIGVSDPKLADFLKSNLVQIEDIEFLTQNMLMSLLRDMDLEVFGLAIKALDQRIIEKVMGQVSTGMRLDIEDGLKSGPTSLEKVQSAQDKLLEVLNKKIENGQIVIDKTDSLV